jgi:hypothetical protein
MPTKPRTCAVQIALDIKKYGLTAVSEAVAMAVALSTEPKPKVVRKPKRVYLQQSRVLQPPGLDIDTYTEASAPQPKPVAS